MNQCEVKNAKLDLQVKILLIQIDPIKKENQVLVAQMKQLTAKNFKLEMTNYGIGIVGILAIYIVARKLFHLKYRKEFHLEVNSKEIINEKETDIV